MILLLYICAFIQTPSTEQIAFINQSVHNTSAEFKPSLHCKYAISPSPELYIVKLKQEGRRYKEGQKINKINPKRN
jgi:hypothetical protein